MDFKDFATNFAQTLPEAEKRPTYDRYIAPTPGLIYLQGALGIGSGIRMGNPRRAPLLIVEGELDRTMDPATVRAAFEKQLRAPSLTEYKVFLGRSHFLFHEPGWEEVADYVINWAEENARSEEMPAARAA